MSRRTEGDVVAIPFGPGERGWTSGVPWFYVALLLLIFPPTRVIGVVALIAGVGDAAGVWRPRRVLLTPVGIEARRMFSGPSVRWTEVAALTTAPVESRHGVGRAVDAVPFGAAPRHPSLRLVLVEDAEPTIRRFIDDHGLDVPVDPTEPWQDRRGGWHAAELVSNPNETIRSIERAWLGPWLIRLELGPSNRARASVVDRRADTTVNVAPWRRSREAATADAERFIAAARRTLDARSDPLDR